MSIARFALRAAPSFAFLMFALAGGEAAAQRGPFCVGDFRFGQSGFVEVQGATRSGQPCMINYGKRSAIMSHQIGRRPANGVLGSAGRANDRYLTAYRSRPGFVGTDVFEVDIRYVPFAGRGARFNMPDERTTRVRVVMTVTP
jgi:hypothetical protein